MDTLLKSLKIPKKYINYISPRCSPKHSLERLIGYIKPKIVNNNKSLCIMTCKIDDETSLEKVINNLNYFKNSESLVLNKGMLKNVNLKYLNCNYYFNIQEDAEMNKIWLSGLSQIDLSQYSNIIFADDTFEIVEPIDNFLERSLYKNCCFLRTEEEYDLSLFSLVLDTINSFAEKLNENKDIQEYLKEIHTKTIWLNKIEESDTEKTMTYEKIGYDDGEDFPMI